MDKSINISISKILLPKLRQLLKVMIRRIQPFHVKMSY